MMKRLVFVSTISIQMRYNKKICKWERIHMNSHVVCVSGVKNLHWYHPLSPLKPFISISLFLSYVIQ